MTAMSWNSSTANEPCPPAVFSRPFSVSVCSAIAVEDSDSASPTATAACQGRPASSPSAASASVVSATCSPPIPRIGARSRHSRLGSSSRPTTNSIITTPNSAACMTSCPGAPSRLRPNGPIATPASR